MVITYNQLYAPYRLAFPFIFPAHVFNGRSDISQDPFNQMPNVGTGPFVITSWASGDLIILDRNPNYREAGKPHLDHLIFKMIPNRDAAVQAFAAGDVDVDV